MITTISQEEQERRVGTALKMQIDHFALYSDGFSFTVRTELEAYKAAYLYRHNSDVKVRQAPGVGRWLVQVYN